MKYKEPEMEIMQLDEKVLTDIAWGGNSGVTNDNPIEIPSNGTGTVVQP